MDTFESVRTVLAVRAFQNKAVAREIKERILEAGRLTGSSSNGQPWHFILVEEHATLQQLSTLPRVSPYTAQADFAVVVVIEHTPSGISDGSRAIQSMILTAWGEGVGSNWVGFAPMPEVNTLLGIPDTLDVLAVLPFGYPVKAVGKGKKKRKAPEDVFSVGKFGTPYTPKM